MTLLTVDQVIQPNERGVLQACSPNPAVDHKNETSNDSKHSGSDNKQSHPFSLSLRQEQTKQTFQDICTLRMIGGGRSDDDSPNDFCYDLSSSSSSSEDDVERLRLPVSSSSSGWSLQDFEYIGRLGKGACAQVYAAQERQSGYRVALKVQEYNANDDMDDDGMMEIDVHWGLEHPNIVRMIDYFVADTGFHPNERYFAHLPFETTPCESEMESSAPTTTNNKYLYMILELCNGGSLYNLGESYPNHRIPEDQAREYFQQAMEAVAYVHAEGRIHCDVKPDNFLIHHLHHHHHMNDTHLNPTTTSPSSFVIQLADFGMAVRNDEREVLGGSPSYMAPEHLCAWQQQGNDDNFDHRVDIYGLGVVLYQLLVGELPYMVVDEEHALDSCDSLLNFMNDLRIDPSSLLEDKDTIVPPILDLRTLNDKDAMDAFFQQTPPEFPSFLSADAVDLIQKLMEPCPDKRMTLAAAKHHPWFPKTKLQSST